MNGLIPHTREAHRVLEARLASATAALQERSPRDAFPAIDTFLASAARHHSAVLAVLVPAMRSHVEGGEEQARNYVVKSRDYELALNQVKAKLYGSIYSSGRSWQAIWQEAREEFDAVWVLEQALADLLAAHRRADDPDWSDELYRAELRAPTRPHPWLPHRGPHGQLARQVAGRVDSFWDSVEGRMTPDPVHHHDRSADSRMTQYLLADPHFLDEE